MLLAVVQHLAVDLVRHQRHVRVLLQAFDELADFAFRHGTAGRIAGRVDDDQPRLRRDAGKQFVGTEGKTVLLAQDDRHRFGTGVLDHRAVDREAGVRIHDLGPRFAEHQHRKEHRRLAAGHDDDAGRRHGDVVTLMQVRRHRLAQRQDAVGRRVAVMAVLKGFDCGFDDVRGRLEVRLTNAERDDVAALGLQRGGPRQHVKRRFRTKSAHAGCKGKHGRSPLWGCFGEWLAPL